MLGLRKFLRAAYGYLAAIFLFASISSVPTLIRVYRADLNRAPDRPDILLWQAILLEATQLVMAIPVPLALFLGVTWWMLRQGKPSGRAWAIATNILMIVANAPLLFTALLTMKYDRAAPPFGVWLVTLIMPAIGIVGLVAFGPRDAIGVAAVARPKPMRVAGDGTSRLFDLIAWSISVAAGIAGWSWCRHWGYAHHLPLARMDLWWLEFVAAILITTSAHEFGHAGVGMALGMKLRMFLVGPFQWRIRDGKWKFEFVLARFFSAGGATAVVPTNPRQSKWIDIAMIAAGPAASLAAGLTFFLLMLTAPGKPYEQTWELFALSAVFALGAVIVNLIPLRPESFYSDGAQIYQLLTGGPWADLHQALSVVHASLVTPLRPRDYDIAAIQRAESHFVRGQQALVLRLIACWYYQDTGDSAKAARSASDAVAIYNESPFEIRPETLLAFVFLIAFLHRDAATARAWWALMEAKKPTHFGVEYWLARCALLWVEGNLPEAREAWLKVNALAQKLPAGGDHDFDRDRATWLGQALNRAHSQGMPVGSTLVAPV